MNECEYHKKCQNPVVAKLEISRYPFLTCEQGIIDWLRERRKNNAATTAIIAVLPETPEDRLAVIRRNIEQEASSGEEDEEDEGSKG